MAGVIENSGIAPLRRSSAKTDHDALLLPDGRRIGQVHAGLTAVFLKLGIPGVSPESGRAAAVESYAVHLQKIHNDAGRNAVAKWLEAHRGA